VKTSLIVGLLLVLTVAACVIAFNTTQSNHREQAAADAKVAAQVVAAEVARQVVVEACRAEFRTKNPLPFHVDDPTGTKREAWFAAFDKTEAKCVVLGKN
jgi:hypothetical protein